MQMDAKLTSTGLHFSMSVSSPRECVIGLHYYYNLILENACITSEVQDQYNDLGIFKPLPEKWMKNDRLHLELNEAADFGFLPLDGSSGEVILLMSRYKLRIAYQGRQNEVSWQLYHPKGSSFVCIEPMSVKNPRRLSSCKSSLNVEIEILPH
jgi:galactose mutarotase-like enzyme